MRRNLVIFTSFISFTAISALSGCDNGVNTGTICKNNPELCSDLHKDSWCRYEKADLIEKRYKLKHTATPTGKELYHHLLVLEKYSSCIELAAGVQHILHPERTNDRVRAFGLSAQSLAQLQETTKGSKDLYLAFYHWTRFNDEKAQAIVLKAEKEQRIDDIELLARIASYYQKFDSKKAKEVYLAVFDLSDEDNFNPDWLLGLANAYQKLNDPELTYLLSRANVLMTDNKVSEKKMMGLISNDESVKEVLDDLADDLVDEIESGDFKTSTIRTMLERDKSAL
ncbi:DUF2989 domain-containing protein [uncultured Shewanella sp.]|uniref:DUF2989 domain-containing protein n=1 Tax=Shewanella atlantica TaxID=271099 RepID=UPI00261DB69B|nr:DUF2989 domain-containing protein [uncultured Shewanella sp.]